jgi:hypothetical protein
MEHDFVADEACLRCALFDNYVPGAETTSMTGTDRDVCGFVADLVSFKYEKIT